MFCFFDYGYHSATQSRWFPASTLGKKTGELLMGHAHKYSLPHKIQKLLALSPSPFSAPQTPCPVRSCNFHISQPFHPPESHGGPEGRRSEDNGPRAICTEERSSLSLWKLWKHFWAPTASGNAEEITGFTLRSLGYRREKGISREQKVSLLWGSKGFFDSEHLDGICVVSLGFSR